MLCTSSPSRRNRNPSITALFCYVLSFRYLQTFTSTSLQQSFSGPFGVFSNGPDAWAVPVCQSQVPSANRTADIPVVTSSKSWQYSSKRCLGATGISAGPVDDVPCHPKNRNEKHKQFQRGAERTEDRDFPFSFTHWMGLKTIPFQLLVCGMWIFLIWNPSDQSAATSSHICHWSW